MEGHAGAKADDTQGSHFVFHTRVPMFRTGNFEIQKRFLSQCPPDPLQICKPWHEGVLATMPVTRSRGGGQKEIKVATQGGGLLDVHLGDAPKPM